MAEGPKEGGDEGFSFVDKVRLMMYGEQEKEAFLIDKKEKEEKKKAKKLAAEAAGENSEPKKKTVFSQVKSFFVSESPKAPKASPEEASSPVTQEAPTESPEESS